MGSQLSKEESPNDFFFLQFEAETDSKKQEEKNLDDASKSNCESRKSTGIEWNDMVIQQFSPFVSMDFESLLEAFERIVIYTLNNTRQKVKERRKNEKKERKFRSLQINHFSKGALRAYMKSSNSRRDLVIEYLLQLQLQKEQKGKPYIIKEVKENIEIFRINCDKFSKKILLDILREGKNNTEEGMHKFLKEWIEEQQARREEKEKMINQIFEQLDREGIIFSQ